MAAVGNEKNRLSISCCHGFSLIEVLFAMLVLGVGLLAIAGMQITAIKGNSQAGKITMATALIEEKLAGYKTMSYENIVDENGVRDIFSWSTKVDPNTPANGLKTITVRASWTEGEKSHDLAFATVVSR